MEAMLEFNAEQTHRAITACHGNAGHAALRRSNQDQLMGKLKPARSYPLSDGATLAIAECVLKSTPRIIAPALEN
jgi:hypothetical protein